MKHQLNVLESPYQGLKRSTLTLEKSHLTQVTVPIGKPIQQQKRLLAQTVRRFSEASSPPLSSLTASHSVKPFLATSDSSFRVEQYIHEAMMKDSAKLIKEKDYLRFPNFYQPSVSRLALGTQQPIHEKVVKRYEDFSKIKNEVNFKQGFLPQLGILYYAVENWLYFVDASKVQKDEWSCTEIEMPEHVLNIKQAFIPAIVTGTNSSESALMICFPWSICLYVYTVTRGLVSFQGQALRYDIACERIQHAQCTQDGRIHYVDDNGAPLTLELQPRSIFRFWTRQPFTLSTRSFRKLTFFELVAKKGFSLGLAFRTFLKEISVIGQSLLPSQVRNRQLYYNASERLLFTLSEESSRFPYPNFSQIVTMYRDDGSRLTEIAAFNSWSVVSEIFSRHCTDETGYEILRLGDSEQCLIPETNLTLLLKNGIRMYLRMEVESRLIHVDYPPSLTMTSLEHPYTDRKIIPCAANPKNYITSGVFRMNESLFLYPNESQPTIAVLTTNMFSNTCQNISLSLFPSALGCAEHNLYAHSFKTNLVPGLRSLVPLSLHSSTVFTQPFCSASMFVYSNQRLLVPLIRLREVDVAFAYLHQFYSSSRCGDDLLRLFNDLAPLDIAASLIQIDLDAAGEYFISSTLTDQIENVLSIKKMPSSRPRNSISSIKISAVLQDICPKVWQSIFELSRLNEKRQGFNDALGFENEHINANNRSISAKKTITTKTKENTERISSEEFISKAICTYLGRLFRLFYENSIRKFTVKQSQDLTRLLQSLRGRLKEASQVRSYSDKGESVPEFVERCIQLFILIKHFSGHLPPYSFRQATMMNAEDFEQFVFLGLVVDYSEDAVDMLTHLIPIFTTKKLMRTVKLYHKVKYIDENRQLLAELEKASQLPPYFLDKLKHTKNFDPSWLELNKSHKDFDAIPTTGLSKMTDGNTAFEQLLTELTNDTKPITQKMLALDECRILLGSQKKDGVSVDVKKRCLAKARELKLQLALLNQYKSMTDCSQDPQVLRRIHTNTLPLPTLRGLCYALEKPSLCLLCAIFSRASPVQFQRHIQSMSTDPKIEDELNKVRKGCLGLGEQVDPFPAVTVYRCLTKCFILAPASLTTFAKFMQASCGSTIDIYGAWLIDWMNCFYKDRISQIVSIAEDELEELANLISLNRHSRRLQSQEPIGSGSENNTLIGYLYYWLQLLKLARLDSKLSVRLGTITKRHLSEVGQSQQSPFWMRIRQLSRVLI